MKLSMVAIALTFVAVVVVGPVVVHADRMVRYLFNNGVDDASAGSCNAVDYGKIDTIFTNSAKPATYGKRNLLRSESTTDLHENEERELQLWHPACKNNCAGWAPTTCRATGCVGYRRQLSKATTATKQRDLQVACSTQVNYLNTEFNKLVTNNLVTPSCKTFLSKPRHVECYDDVKYGVVEKFVLWKTTAPQTVLNSDYTGQNICRSTEITFEAITNDCVDFLLTSIRGPNGYYRESGEYERPFSVFGDKFGVGGNFNGVTLPYLGQYTLTALPDGLTEKAKVMTFNIINC
jgi:hypothetical protein